MRESQADAVDDSAKKPRTPTISTAKKAALIMIGQGSKVSFNNTPTLIERGRTLDSDSSSDDDGRGEESWDDMR